MEKKKFKKVFSKAFVASIAAMALANTANAYNVTETLEDTAEGTYIYGITRYSNETPLTTGVTGKAVVNEMAYLGYPADYEPPILYQYLFGEWIGYDADGKDFTPSSDVINKLNERDIFYVDNVEKTIPVHYERDIPEDCEIIAKSSKPNQVVEYDAETSTLYIPVTAPEVTVYQHKKDAEDNTTDTTLDSYQRTQDNNNESEFDFTNNSASYGTINIDGIYTKNATVRGNTVTINDIIPWNNGKDSLGVTNSEGVAIAGHRIGVKLTVPNGTNVDPINLAKIEVKVTPYDNDSEKSEVYKWTVDNTDKNNQFWFTPIVKEGETYTLEVTWNKQEQIKQTFTINVNGALEEMPAGVVAGEEKYVLDEENKPTSEVRLSAEYRNDVLTFSGKNAEWNENVTVLVTPDSYYTDDENFVLGSAEVTYTYKEFKTVDGEEKWVDSDAQEAAKTVKTIDGTPMLAITLPIAEDDADKEGRTRTVTVKWPDGYEQIFDVVLSDDTDFVYPDVVLNSVQTTKPFSPEENTPNEVEVTGIVGWNREEGGNRVTVNLQLPDTRYNKKYLTVRANGEVITKKDGTDEPVKFANNGSLTFDFIIEKGINEVEVLYNGEKIVKTFKIDASKATLEEAPEGSIELGTENSTINGSYSRTNKTLTVYGKNDDSKIAFDYKLYNNAVAVKLKNDEYNESGYVTTAKKVVYRLNNVEQEAKLEGDSYNIKVGKNKSTTVTVYWDDINSQTFTLKVDSEVKFDTAKSGNIYVGDTFTENGDTLELTDENTATWGGTTNLENGVNGYVTDDSITIASPTDSITELSEGAYLTITGGHYGSKGIRLDATSLRTLFNSSSKLISLKPILATANDKLTVTVCWGGEFVETYYINAIGVELQNNDVMTLSIGDNSTTNGTIDYSGVVKYDTVADNGFHKVEVNTSTVASTNDILKATIKDANPTEKENDSDEKATIRDIKDDITNDNKISVYLTDEVRIAEITIEWKNGFKQVITINGSKAKLPTIILNDSLDKDEEGNYKTNSYDTNNDGKVDEKHYSLTLKVGDSINFIAGTSPVDYSQYIQYKTVGANKSPLDATKDILDIEKMKASSLGMATLEVTLKDDTNDMGAKSILVDVNVVANEPVVISNQTATIDSDNNKIIVTADVAGGYTGIYDVDAIGYIMTNGNYETLASSYGAGADTVTVTDHATIKNANGKYVMEFEFSGPKEKVEEILAKNFKFTINATDKAHDDLSNDNTLVDSVDIETKPVQYRVTINPENGSESTNLSVKPGTTIGKLKLAKDLVKESTKPEIKYVFTGWARSTDVTDGKLNDGKNLLQDGDTITANTIIVAIWDEVPVSNKVTLIYSDGYTEIKDIPYNEVIAQIAGQENWYEYNSTNFDSLGNLTNNPVPFDPETKITDKLTLKNTNEDVKSPKGKLIKNINDLKDNYNTYKTENADLFKVLNSSNMSSKVSEYTNLESDITNLVSQANNLKESGDDYTAALSNFNTLKSNVDGKKGAIENITEVTLTDVINISEDFTLNNLTINSAISRNVFNVTDGNVTLNNVNMNGAVGNHVVNISGGTLNINGGTITANGSQDELNTPVNAINVQGGIVNITNAIINSATYENLIDTTSNTAFSNAIYVNSGTINIDGEDTIITGGKGVLSGAVYASTSNSTVNIKNGKFATGKVTSTLSNSCINAMDNGAKINISGGTFEAPVQQSESLSGLSFVLFVEDDASVIEVTGGKFTNYNPSSAKPNGTAADNKNFVKTGYTASETPADSNIWVVTSNTPTE